MAYKSTHTGEQIDAAVNAVLNKTLDVKYANLTGTLADQTDLQAAIDAKVNAAGLKSKGDATVPVYMNANGVAVAVKSYEGTAAKATADDRGNVITTTYAKEADVASKAKADFSNVADSDKLVVLNSAKAIKNPVFSTGDRDYVNGKIEQVFDREAFTVVGNPTISEDGIASGFSGANRIRLITLKELNGKSWVFTGEYTPIANDTVCTILSFGNYNGPGCVQFNNSLKQLQFVGKFGDTGSATSEWVYAIETPSLGQVNNIKVKLGFNITTGTYTLSYSINNNSWVTLPSYIPTSTEKQLYVISTNSTQSVYINAFESGYNYRGKGAYDLTQFSITVDGVQVFSGTKPAFIPGPADGFRADKLGYTELEAEKRSTFDRSKFTVVGNPTITDDGIASGFSDGNYLKKPLILSMIDTTKSVVKIKGKIRTPKEMPSSRLTVACLGDLTFIVHPDGTMRCYDWKYFNFNSGGNYELDTTYYIEFGVDYLNRTFYSKFKKENSAWNESWAGPYDKISDLSLVTNFIIGAKQNLIEYYIGGDISLSEISIYVDGIEVFNGNKTGIDQIKKDDYTEVGKPNISNGILTATTVDYTNYVKIPFDNTSRNFKASLKWKTPDVEPTSYCIGGYNNGSLDLYLNKNYNSFQLRVLYKDSDGNKQASSKADIITDYIPNHDYFITYERKYNIIYCSVDNKISSSIINIGDNDLYYDFIGLLAEYKNNQSLGSIDLSSIKIEYLDKNTVYIPTIYIPYTQSKTGNKIVDSVYRDRVQDMYEQFGYTHYYTLGDEKEKYNVSVVGSPTLVGGVASGFSVGSALKISTIDTSKPFSIKAPFNFKTLETTRQTIYGANTSGLLRLCSLTDGRLALSLSENTSDWTIIDDIPSTKKINANTLYYIELEFTGTKYKVNISTDNITYTNYITIDSTSLLSNGSFNNLILGTQSGAYSFPFLGQIDLSQFSITVDGKEVFRGYDPAIPNCYTLPQGENIRSQATVTMQDTNYAFDTNMNLVQRGTYAAGTATVQFPKAFADTNYYLSCPYSAKTTTGFTPADTTVARDYIARGKATLDVMYKA